MRLLLVAAAAVVATSLGIIVSGRGDYGPDRRLADVVAAVHVVALAAVVAVLLGWWEL